MSRGWAALITILLGLIGLGAYAYYYQFTHGLAVTGLRDIGTMQGAAWGLYITFDIYFVGVSFAGITVASLIRLMNLKHLRPVSRMAELLTVTSLITAGLVILPDLGQPIRGLINLFRYARPESPFFGTFTLVISGYLFGSLVYLYLSGRRDAAILAQRPSRLQWFHRLWAAGYKDTPAERRRHSITSLLLAVAIMPLLVTAHSTLGFVFGLQVGRPGWFGALQAPAFVIMAGISGVGMLLIIAAILRRVLGLKKQLPEAIFKWLGTLMLVLILAYLYFMVVDWLTATYAGDQHEVRVTQALLIGEYAWLFWGAATTLLISAGVLITGYLPIPQFVFQPRFQRSASRLARLAGLAALGGVVLLASQVVPATQKASLGLPQSTPQWLLWIVVVLGLLAILFYLPVLCRSAIARGVVTGLLVNLAAIIKRYLIVVPSQTHGTLLPYNIGYYRPTWVEYSIILGLFALGTLIYVGFVKTFPILEVEIEEKSEPPLEELTRVRITSRGLLAWGMVVFGFALQGISYFYLAAPLGVPVNESFSNPRLPFAPTLFILGVMTVFLAAVVYELIPERQPGQNFR
jgi:Ni/Fe-hydrogenase subunit HybB-like protein